MKNIWMTMEDGESAEVFIGRCRAAVHNYLLPRIGGPRPMIVDSRQAGGCYHGHPHKSETACGLAGHQPAVESATPHTESGAHYEPTAEAIALCGVRL